MGALPKNLCDSPENGLLWAPGWMTPDAVSLDDGTPWNLFGAVVVERGDLDEESQVFSKERAGTCT